MVCRAFGDGPATSLAIGGIYLTSERGSEGCTENFSGMICVYLLTRRRVVADDLIPVHAQHGWIVQAHASDARQQHAVEATLAVA